MPKSSPPWYFLQVTTILGILIVGILYILGANLLKGNKLNRINFQVPRKKAGSFVARFFIAFKIGGTILGQLDILKKKRSTVIGQPLDLFGSGGQI